MPEGAKERLWEQDTFAEISAHVDLFKGLADGPDPEVRSMAYGLVASISATPGEDLQFLVEAARVEVHPLARPRGYQ